MPKKLLLSALAALLCLTLPAQNGSLKVTGVTVQEAIYALSESQGWSVSVKSTDADLSRKISVNLENRPIDEVLSAIFAGQDVSWTVSGKFITVTKKAAPKNFEGLVIDENGEPLIGVSLLVTGTQNGTFTDIDGKFVFENPRYPLNLTVSYIGFEDQNVTITGKEAQPWTLTMGSSASALDEVVVVGYGTQKKASLSGAVAIVSGKEINSRPVVSAANALQGADPSMNISFGTGSPEGGYNLNIRGTISLNGGSPLVLADGVELELSQINPNDIESVSVLKDASSCAIYGAKASAGVILITTKQGKRGDNSTVTYSGRVGWQSNTTSTDFIDNGYDHVTLVNNFMNNSSDGTRTIFLYTEENGGLQKLLDRRGDKTENPDRPWIEVDDNGNYMYYGNFDWYGYLYRRVRPQTEHNISVSGGSEKISYYASARYLYQKGMFNVADDTYQDFSTRAKISAKVKNWLKYSANISYRRSNYNYGGYENYEGTISSLQANISPAFMPFNPDGTVVQYVNQLGKNSPMGSGRVGLLSSKVATNDKTNSYFTMTHSLDFYIAEPFFIVFDSLNTGGARCAPPVPVLLRFISCRRPAGRSWSRR